MLHKLLLQSITRRSAIESISCYCMAVCVCRGGVAKSKLEQQANQLVHLVWICVLC